MREEVLSAPGFRRWNFKQHGSHIDRKPPHIDQKVRASPQDSIILTAQCFSFSTATCQTLDWNHTALWLRCCSLHTRACPGRMIRIFASQINDRFPPRNLHAGVPILKPPGANSCDTAFSVLLLNDRVSGHWNELILTAHLPQHQVRRAVSHVFPPCSEMADPGRKARRLEFAPWCSRTGPCSIPALKNCCRHLWTTKYVQKYGNAGDSSFIECSTRCNLGRI